MKKIYILLTRSDTILSRVVHLVTADCYTHVSIAFDKSLQPLYSSSRKNGRTLFPAGPCREHLCGGYYQKHGQIPCVLYELPVTDEVYRSVKQQVQYIMENEQEYHFNIIGLILCQLNVPYHRERHFFCSQFVSQVLEENGAIALPKDPTLMKPSDYMELPGLVVRFQGRLRDLVQRQPTPAYV